MIFRLIAGAVIGYGHSYSPYDPSSIGWSCILHILERSRWSSLGPDSVLLPDSRQIIHRPVKVYGNRWGDQSGEGRLNPWVAPFMWYAVNRRIQYRVLPLWQPKLTAINRASKDLKVFPKFLSIILNHCVMSFNPSWVSSSVHIGAVFLSGNRADPIIIQWDLWGSILVFSL